MILFKTLGFLPSSEPAIGRSQEQATDGWRRRKAELPLLVVPEEGGYPQESRMDLLLGVLSRLPSLPSHADYVCCLIDCGEIAFHNVEQCASIMDCVPAPIGKCFAVENVPRQ